MALPSHHIALLSGLLAATALVWAPQSASATDARSAPASPLIDRRAEPLPVVITLAQDDNAMDSDDDEDTDGQADAQHATDRFAHEHSSRSSDDQRRPDRRAGGRYDEDRGRGWSRMDRGMAEDDRRSWRDGAGWSPDRRRMMAMHGRMMQMMRGGQQGAAFRVQVGDVSIGFRCQPGESTRDCVDAAVSLVTRIRDANAGTKPRETGAAPSSPSPGSTTSPGSPTPQ